MSHIEYLHKSVEKVGVWAMHGALPYMLNCWATGLMQERQMVLMAQMGACQREERQPPEACQTTKIVQKQAVHKMRAIKLHFTKKNG